MDKDKPIQHGDVPIHIHIWRDDPPPKRPEIPR